MGTSPLEGFESLRLEADVQQRGYLLEGLVAKLFRRGHFEVELDPAAALPRQTDLVARGDGSDYLIETRWRSKPASSADVDDIHARLRRTPPRVDGILVSVEGFTPDAIKQIEAMRDQRLVVPIDGVELQSLFSDPSELRPYLRRKRSNLLVHGAVSRPLDRPIRRAADLPEAALSIWSPDGRTQDVVAGTGSYSGMTFWRTIPDIDWAYAHGNGVACDLQVDVDSRPQLLGVLHELAEMGWAGSGGQWTISQSERVWHGFGPRSLASAVEDQEERIADLEHVHHTEELAYVDECAGGFYSLTAQPMVGQARVWPVRISFQLEGVPFDTLPFQRFAQKVSPGTEPYFRPLATSSMSMTRFATPLPLDIVTAAVEGGQRDGPEEWVVGIVARNPFFSNREQLAELGVDPLDLGARVEGNEFLVCDLRSWHPIHEQRDYVLMGLDFTSTSDLAIIRPLADWAD